MPGRGVYLSSPGVTTPSGIGACASYRRERRSDQLDQWEISSAGITAVMEAQPAAQIARMVTAIAARNRALDGRCVRMGQLASRFHQGRDGSSFDTRSVSASLVRAASSRPSGSSSGSGKIRCKICSTASMTE